MELPQNNIVYMENAIADDIGPVVSCALLSDLLNFQMKNNPALANMTKADIAKDCGMSESTLKNLLNGKNDNPHVGTLKRLLRRIGGGSIDRLVGFAPPRDFAKEAAEYDANLVEAIQIRLEEKRARIGELESQLRANEAELDRLRKLVLKKSDGETRACTEVEALNKLIMERDASIARRDKMIRNRNKIIFVFAIIFGAITLVDLLFANVGWFGFGPIK